MFLVRNPRPDEVDVLARLWFDGWHDAHAEILPEALRRHRTLDSFDTRLRAMLDDARVAERGGRPVGLAVVKAEELDQFYVAADARGSGVAAALMEDALARLRAAGVGTAWLACAIGNTRAARFYEKSGWVRTGVVRLSLPTPDGPFALDVWRYERAIERES